VRINSDTVQHSGLYPKKSAINWRGYRAASGSEWDKGSAFGKDEIRAGRLAFWSRSLPLAVLYRSAPPTARDPLGAIPGTRFDRLQPFSSAFHLLAFHFFLFTFSFLFVNP
jgi:hypothetical protein